MVKVLIPWYHEVRIRGRHRSEDLLTHRQESVDVDFEGVTKTLTDIRHNL